MYSDLAHETQSLLSRHGVRLRKRLGQNFVVDADLIEEILSIACPSREDAVLEIGAGLGTLTKALAQHASSVKALELDPALVQILRGEVSNLPHVEVVQADVLKISLPNAGLVVSNVPYSISSPLLLKLLQSPTWEFAVLTLQKDFAARLSAEPGTKDYGRLTLAASYYAEVKLHGSYPPSSFFPPPKVYSQIVELKRRSEPAIKVADTLVFWELSRLLFTQRNRLLAKALKTLAKGGDTPGVWSQVLLGAAPERLLVRRVRELGLSDFAALSDLVSSRAGVGLG